MDKLSRRGFMATAAGVTVAAVAGKVHAQNANSRLGVALIGCGGRGGGHLNVLKKIKETENNIDIVALADVYRPRLERAAKEFGVENKYMDHREMLNNKKVNAVFIATPDHLHAYHAIDAINAGKDVYCEKPVTHWRQFDVTKRLADVVAKSDRVFQLGTQGMSDGAWHQMRKLVQDGLIGQPLHAECGYFRTGDWGERGMPIDDPNAKPGPDLNWEAFLGDSPKRDFDVSRFFRWRMYEDYAGGPSTDLFPHSLTPTLYILGLKFPSMVVSAGGKWRYEEREVPDTFNMLADYPEKVTIAVLGTQGNNHQGVVGRGAGGRVPIIRGWNGTITVAEDNKQIVFIPTDDNKKDKVQRWPIEQKEDMVFYFQRFLDCCRNRDKNTLSPMDLAFHVQTALQMGSMSLKEGKVAKFDQEKQTIVL
jgi:predicted dehydrogenase